ncbi:MAG: type II toxin-antitoxin system death-on-curing family toxin [Gemmatimonadaceae bacterium]|nr:type II toxin-antitoxin system death-on-curing family toxin [Gemmatimonadaceae bacterium]
MKSIAIQEEPVWITGQSLFVIHAQQIEAFGGLHGVLSENVVLSALTRPIHLWAYRSDVDFADLAAAYLVAFGTTQGFNDGNKRTALACALVFLGLNGLRISVAGQELYDVSMHVATNKIGSEEVAAWFRSNISGE